MPTLTARGTNEEQTVHVTAWGATTEVLFRSGKSVAYYLKEARVTGLSSNQVVKLNGNRVWLLSFTTVGQPDSTIEVVNKSQS